MVASREYYAYQNKATGRLVSGTNYREDPHVQFFSDKDNAPLLMTEEEAKLWASGEYLHAARGITRKSFRLVKVQVTVVETVSD